MQRRQVEGNISRISVVTSNTKEDIICWRIREGCRQMSHENKSRKKTYELKERCYEGDGDYLKFLFLFQFIFLKKLFGRKTSQISVQLW